MNLPKSGDNMGDIVDVDDQLIGQVDYGKGSLHDIINSDDWNASTGSLHDAQGSTIAELRKGGELRGHWGMTCGRLEGFDFHKMQTAAAYIMLIDRDMVKGK